MHTCQVAHYQRPGRIETVRCLFLGGLLAGMFYEAKRIGIALCLFGCLFVCLFVFVCVFTVSSLSSWNFNVVI